ncbi:MAG TPA: DsbE family thiol:disulfide interchange protein [Rhizomicrobium sp.]|nr:DsbE family thiol:disulfide interchange protein [Rhizomicrobium sp.]
MNRALALIPVGLFAALLVSFYFALGRDPTHIPSVLIDKPLPGFSLPGVAAGTPGLSSHDLRGQPILLNVFGSWCISCVQEHPMLMELAREGVVIDGIDWRDQAIDGAKWLDQNGNPYARVGNDKTGRTGIDLGVTGAPETFVVDARGRVRYKQIGPIDSDTWNNTLLPLLKKLRSES